MNARCLTSVTSADCASLFATELDKLLVCYTAVFSVVTQRCVTTLKKAV